MSRACVLSMVVSVDGYINGPGGEFIPPAWSADLDAWTASHAASFDTMLFGRAAWRSPLHTSALRGWQYLGRPALSAGVERMFSKAGKLYGDDKKGEEDGTLEAMLFAAANTE